ncbi:hypothetical protein [Aurantiacibacter luteus]|uniref:Uncharacterized protein n=1 Tax=Aurantiacibacter luteus TaxID=1581420 RepID=A0A0G9MZ57_9SPHN|nr:hypothetical protein [Aurantiacibacter luteus]KLE34563.1 hypothetical protein AAW00_10180 [Aurantiacibacter luteus]
MIGKIIGAAAGAAAGNAARGVTGTSGAILGALAVPLARRMGFLGLLGAIGAGYLVKRAADKGDLSRDPASSTSRPATLNTPANAI